MLRALLARTDRFTLGLLLAAILGFSLPCYGGGVVYFSSLMYLAIVLLFFLYGAKISRKTLIDGMLHWRLQSLVAAFTYLVFPLLFLLLRPLLQPLMGEQLYIGMLYLSCLPSTVQSSVAFTSVAGGNVPAAICSASFSSLLGIFMTPLLVSLLLSQSSDGSMFDLSAIKKIIVLILFPFFVGHILRPYLKGWVERHKKLISWNDQSTVWLTVYTSFSAATCAGFWALLEPITLVGVVVACAICVSLLLTMSYYLSRWLRFSREDCITIAFCGSKKSLALGAPMMIAIFGYIDQNLLLPLLVFHQVQLLICSGLARRWRSASNT